MYSDLFYRWDLCTFYHGYLLGSLLVACVSTLLISLATDETV